LFAPRRITITGPKVLRVTFARSTFGLSEIGPRSPAVNADVIAASPATRSISRPFFSGAIQGLSLRRKSRASIGLRAKRSATSATKLRMASLRTVTVRGTVVFGCATSACCTARCTDGAARFSDGASNMNVPYVSASGSANCERTYSVACSALSPPTRMLPIETPSGIVAGAGGTGSSAARAGAQTRTARAAMSIERRFKRGFARGFAGRR
jgi:hypothetical protein